MNDTPSTLKQIIGKTVKAIRLKQGLSQEDLAHECNVDRSYISMIEVGRNEPSITKIFELCRSLKVAPSDFIKMVEIEYNRGREQD
ncbi:helix-turn-helix domain-containing protein [Paenibacillus sp. FSL R7-0179]|uniref:helix-turn-helix domain-containing protein n=1 Tax=Paenibacillus sp. FSL R7-0179 TaxID=2921672 RepID=UPI0030FA126C